MTHPAARPEILFVRRLKPESTGINENTRDAHVAFPGGRTEEGDEGSLYTGIKHLLSPCPCPYPLSCSHASDLGGNWSRPR